MMSYLFQIVHHKPAFGESEEITLAGHIGHNQFILAVVIHIRHLVPHNRSRKLLARPLGNEACLIPVHEMNPSAAEPTKIRKYSCGFGIIFTDKNFLFSVFVDIVSENGGTQ